MSGMGDRVGAKDPGVLRGLDGVTVAWNQRHPGGVKHP
jgi:hypothetical protein